VTAIPRCPDASSRRLFSAARAISTKPRITPSQDCWGPIVPHPTVPALAGTEAVLDIDGENARASYWQGDVTFVEAFPQFSGCAAY